MGALDNDTWRSGSDPLRLFLCSIGSATASPIISEYLRDDFIAPIAGALQGGPCNERAAMLAGSIVRWIGADSRRVDVGERFRA